jgi:ketosteroid isomerase-like protein
MTKPGLKAVAIAASSLILLSVAPAHAGADAVRAEAYFNAISGGNADTITSFYADDAEFHWIGGPLAGVYKGKDKIKGLWDKFSKAAGDLDHEVLQLSESANGKTSTVTARVNFKGEGEVPVKFIMIYKDGKIASEVWQVDKAAATSAKVDVRPDAAAEPKAEAEAKAGAPVPPPAAKPAPTIAVQTIAPAVKPAAPAAKEPKLAKAPDQPPAGPDGEAEAPGAEDLPEGAEGPETAEAAPEKDIKAEPKPGGEPKLTSGGEPKLTPGGEPKLKATEEKKGGYGEKFEEKKVAKKKRYYDEAYGYDDDGYGYGWRGGHGGHGGYGGGYGGYGRGGYGHY